MKLIIALPSLSVALLVSPAIFSPFVQAQPSDSTKSIAFSNSRFAARQLQDCPDYRYLDTVYPETPIFGAPDGCRCWEGLSELHCSYCEDDAPCQQYDPSHGCRKGFRHSENDQRIAYKCRLFGEYLNMFENGKASFYFDFPSGTANVTVLNTRNIDSFHLMDCQMSGCEFDMEGGSGATCEVAFCECTQQCDAWVVDVVDQWSNKPAQIVVESPNSVNSVVSIIVEGQAIETNCTASQCTADIDPDWDAYEAAKASESGKESNESSAASYSRWMLSLPLMVLVMAHTV